LEIPPLVGTVTATAVFFTALATAVATGLGALPFAFRPAPRAAGSDPPTPSPPA